MNSNLYLVSDKSRRKFQLVLGARTAAHSQSKTIVFNDPYYTRLFLLNLNVDYEFWLNLLHYNSRVGVYIKRDDLYATLTDLILTKRICFYELPSYSRIATHDGRGKGYGFLKGPALFRTDGEATIFAIRSKADVEALLSRLNVDKQFWERVIKENELSIPPTSSGTQADLQNVVGELIEKGALVVYQFPYRSGISKKDSVETEEIVRLVPASLGPHASQQKAVTKTFKFLISS